MRAQRYIKRFQTEGGYTMTTIEKDPSSSQEEPCLSQDSTQPTLPLHFSYGSQIIGFNSQTPEAITSEEERVTNGEHINSFSRYLRQAPDTNANASDEKERIGPRRF